MLEEYLCHALWGGPYLARQGRPQRISKMWQEWVQKGQLSLEQERSELA